VLIISKCGDTFKRMNRGSNPKPAYGPVKAEGMSAMAGGIRKVIGRHGVPNPRR